MDSLQRMEKLGQIKGMAYEPTPSDVIMANVAPNCHDPNACRDFDMDYFNSDFAELWAQPIATTWPTSNRKTST
jgi:hypothetical protein